MIVSGTNGIDAVHLIDGREGEWLRHERCRWRGRWQNNGGWGWRWGGRFSSTPTAATIGRAFAGTGDWIGGPLTGLTGGSDREAGDER